MLGISAETLLIGELNSTIWTISHSRDTFYISYTLICYVDFINPGETIDISYFVAIDETPPELDDANNYYHEVIALNGELQEESAACIPVYSDLLDASIGSSVCDVISELGIANEVGTGFLDLEALPTITGNIIDVPFIRLNDSSLISAVFQVVNFGAPELELLSYQTIDGDLSPVTESRFDEETGRLSIFALALDQAAYNLEVDVVDGYNPVRFDNLLLFEVMETDDVGDDAEGTDSDDDDPDTDADG